MIRISKGLDLPIAGAPKQVIEAGHPVKRVAVIGFDYHGMKPTMAVQPGDRVKRGQLLFSDKKNEGIKYTAPASGVVAEINRGERRVFQSLVIDVEGDEAVQFKRYEKAELSSLEREAVVEQLIESGEWTAFRTRPFSKVPAKDAEPHSIFVTAMDTHPLAADPAVILAEAGEDFENGLWVISTLTRGKVFVCTRPGVELKLPANGIVQQETFDGPHPAGLAGTHIHFLDPVDEHKSVWTIGYQDVIAIGRLFTTGERSAERVIALAGPSVKNPRLVRTLTGASLADITEGELLPGKHRVISGSIFGGRTGRGPVAYLGRYANQVSCLEEGDKKEFMGWLSPGKDKFSLLNIYISKFIKPARYRFTTNTNGSERAMVPVGTYEEVMPLDILPTQLLRALIVGDTEMAAKLGALELDEEDLALCTFACPGKYEYGPILRDVLTRIEIEG
ncbi:Na(+)-translocating NADH-quinone reductase subunit A [Hahella sp. SMD15-11]|uniref:Na(+)-translocating NADH-quinone reductase subunit A n=1 Tax=Thermohahella caldifontis TaxID=3142973 RepID=A0AB39UZ89_9GAMM